MRPVEKKARLEERQNQILSTISHDLKSPVSAMVGFANLMKSELEEGPRQERHRGFLARIADAGMQTLALIDSILVMARLEAGREPIDPVRIDDPMADFADTVTMFQMEAQAKLITLTFRPLTPLPPVCWDMGHIRYRALNNVISNALKFTPTGGSVDVTVAEEEGWVTITVADTGPGIPEGEEERIFRMFEQVDLTSVRTHRSAGLGLANARHFVELSGGSLTAVNRDEGGARFVFRLPVAPKNRFQASA